MSGKVGCGLKNRVMMKSLVLKWWSSLLTACALHPQRGTFQYSWSQPAHPHHLGLEVVQGHHLFHLEAACRKDLHARRKEGGSKCVFGIVSGRQGGHG